ncbi:phosphopantetheine-binding protein [Streptomyces sp. URMC 123]|uniref:phosphopantetheine-binding protein n=1 Tax=Streptomyces sp. URMC 123 TaxID=3423403 RepID=UPI003F1DC330
MDRAPMTAETIRADVAEILDRSVSDIGVDDNLLALGLDSIRMMTLSARWRENGVEISYVDLAKEPTVRNWSELLGAPAAH